MFYKLRGIGPLYLEAIPGEFNCRALHPQANAKKRQIVFPGILNGLTFSFYAPVTESSGNQHPGNPGKRLLGPLKLNRLRINLFYLHQTIIGYAAMAQGLIDRSEERRVGKEC